MKVSPHPYKKKVYYAKGKQPRIDLENGIEEVWRQHVKNRKKKSTQTSPRSTIILGEPDGTNREYHHPGTSPGKILALFIPKDSSIVGIGNGIGGGEFDIVKDAKKFNALMDQTGMVLFVDLSYNPQIHYLELLNIYHHGGIVLHGLEYETIVNGLVKFPRIRHVTIRDDENFFHGSEIGVTIINDFEAAGISESEKAAMMQQVAVGAVLRSGGKIDKLRKGLQTHISINNRNTDKCEGYGGHVTKAAMSVPESAKNGLFTQAETMMKVLKRLYANKYGIRVYHDQKRNMTSCAALSEAAFDKPSRPLFESYTYYQSPFIGGCAAKNLSFHTDRLNDFRTGYNISASFSQIVRVGDGADQELHRQTSIMCSRKFCGDRFCKPREDYPESACRA